MSEKITAESEIRNYTAALVQSSAQLTSIMDHMIEYSQANPSPSSKPFVIVLTDLLEGVLAENLDGFEPAELETAGKVLVAATDAIGNDVMFVRPEGPSPEMN